MCNIHFYVLFSTKKLIFILQYKQQNIYQILLMLLINNMYFDSYMQILI